MFIGETIADKPERGALPYIPIDPPTIQMEFAVNDSPLAGQDGKLVTARHIWDNVQGKQRVICLHSEDVMLYRSQKRGAEQ